MYFKEIKIEKELPFCKESHYLGINKGVFYDKNT